MLKTKRISEIRIPKHRYPHGLLSTLDADDKRVPEFLKDIKDDGFCGADLWSLDFTIAEFVLPRLKAFRYCTGGYPACFDSVEEWQVIIDKMIIAFEIIVADCATIKNQDINVGLELFAKYFRNLWC